MNRDALHILLADNDTSCLYLFEQALKDIRIKTVLHTASDGSQLMAYLNQPPIRLPNIVFIDYFLPSKNGISCLKEIRKDQKLQNLTIAVYSQSDSDTYLEEAFINGANVFFKRPYDMGQLKTILDHVCNLNWQYTTSGLRKENFMLSFKNIRIHQKSDAVLESA
jgi:CheY-like chemotaxis protein